MMPSMKRVVRLLRSTRNTVLSLLATILILGMSPNSVAADVSVRPNVIVIVTDDQGYGDMSCHGNPWLRTPHLDRLASQSVSLEDYHVAPVCTPTRASLMTGRYCTRVGAWAVTQGRQLLAKDEVTMAQVFKQSGYRSGIFGKWHLGDAYPFAPRFRGFDESVVHRAGGVDEIGNPTGNDYFNDTYYRNGTAESFEGYCTDVWFDEAMRFISETPREQPFFVYLPTNAMHSPHIVAPKYSQRFLEQGLPEKRAHFYGMIENFDENLGRLLSYLQSASLEGNTILIFMGDNGTAQGGNGNSDKEDGFNSGMRGKKGSVYEGGHRVACFVRWQGHLQAGLKVDQLTSHRDWLPTLIDLCQLKAPPSIKFDGTSMVELLQNKPVEWPDRILFIERQDDDIQLAELSPKANRVPFAVLTQQWRLVNGELYDIENDPSQRRNVANQNPHVVEDLYQQYRRHYSDVMQHRGTPVAIPVGSPGQHEVSFTVRDWHPIQGAVIWQQEQLGDEALWINGWWQIDVQQDGQYEVQLRRFPTEMDRSMNASAAEIQIGDQSTRKSVQPTAASATFELSLEKGSHRLQTWLYDTDSQHSRGAYFVDFSPIVE